MELHLFKKNKTRNNPYKIESCNKEISSTCKYGSLSIGQIIRSCLAQKAGW
ncbi:hypothetical protein MNBD_GAMMA05-29 [hydrothermal vent metagenome]|uniref:Uncharacterized protein n=1 Tax=hydrothermal vent metagenome TaxID=652676 RepID=A0A3B0X4T7_9ZZZZ